MMIGRPGLSQRPPLREVSASGRNEAMPVSPARTPTTPRLSMRKATDSYSDVAKKAAASLAAASSEEDRAPVYSDIYEFLRFADSSSAVSLWSALPTADVVSLLTDDIIAGTSVIALPTCNVFNHLVRHTPIAKSFPDGPGLLVEMCRGVLRRADKPLYPLCMACIANQKMNSAKLESKLGVVMGLWEELMRSPNPSSVMLLEGINAYQRLQTDFPAVLAGKLLQCVNVLYPLLVSSTPKVRTKVLAIMVASKERIIRLGGTFLVRFAPDFKKTLNAQLLALMEAGNEIYVLEVWSLLVELLGKALHQGPFINETLKIAQQAFRKQSMLQIQAAAFKAWCSLIANFQTDPKVLAVPKRLGLIMKPLQSNITAAPIPAMDEARAVCWWRLVEALGDAAPSHFTAVCIPLLEFCLFPVPATGDSALLPSSTAGRCARCPMIGCQILASMLETRLPPHSGSQSFAPLAGVVLSTEMFVSALPTLTTCVCSLATCCTDAPAGPAAAGSDALVAQEIVPASWLQSVLTAFGHRLTMLASTFTANPGCESPLSPVLRRASDDLLACLRSLMAAEKPSPSPVRLLLQTILSLPESTLLAGKSVHSLQPATGDDNRSCDTLVPAVVLLAQVWFRPPLLCANLKSERYFILYERLVVLGLQSIDVLDFVQALVALLNSSYSDLRVLTELPWRLWSALAHRLHRYLVQEQKVAQGARLAPHFTAIHQTLLFAANRLLHLKLPQATQRDLVKTWVDLYRAFSTAATLNEDVESNEWLHGLCDEIKLDSTSLGGLHSVVQLLDTVVGCADFSPEPRVVKSISMSPFKQSPSGQSSSSSVGNLRPLLELLRRACEVTYNGLGFRPSGGGAGGMLVAMSPAPLSAASSSASSAGPASAQLMSTLTRVLSQLMSARHILAVLRCLCPSLALFVTALDSKQGALKTVTFPSGFVAKLEKLWTSLLTCVQSRYNRPFDSDLLAAMAPVLAPALDHTNRAVRTRTLVFWNATFAAATHLEYPAVLRTALSRVKKKSPITLPGWVDEVSGTSEPMTELNTQEAEAQGMFVLRPDVSASPKKTWGSFLGRTVASSPSKSPFMKAASTSRVSPARSPAALVSKSPANRNVRRRLPLSFDAESARTSFVRIESSKTKKSSSVLTDHQQEMKDRKIEIPALYSLVDQSQESTTSKFGSLKRKATADSPPARKRAFSTNDPVAQPSLAFLVDEDTQFDMPFLRRHSSSSTDDDGEAALVASAALSVTSAAAAAPVTSTPIEENMLLVVEATCDGITTTTTETETVTEPTSAATTGVPVDHAARRSPRPASAPAPDASSNTTAAAGRATATVPTQENDELATMPYDTPSQQQEQPQEQQQQQQRQRGNQSPLYHAPPETPTIQYIPPSQGPDLGYDDEDTNDANYGTGTAARGKSLQPSAAAAAPMMSHFNFIDESTQDHTLPMADLAPPAATASTSSSSPQSQPRVLMMPRMSPIMHRSRSRSRSPSPRNAGALLVGGGMINDTLCLSSLFTSTPTKPAGDGPNATTAAGSTAASAGTAEANKTTRDLSMLIDDDSASLLRGTPSKQARRQKTGALTPHADVPMADESAAAAAVTTTTTSKERRPSTPARLQSTLLCHRSTSGLLSSGGSGSGGARHLRSGRFLAVPASPAAASPIVSPRARSSRKRKYVDDSPGATAAAAAAAAAAAGGGSGRANSTPDADGSSMLLQIFTPDASVVFANPDSSSMPTSTLAAASTELDAVRSPPPDTNISCSRVQPNSAASTAAGEQSSSQSSGAGKRGRGRTRKTAGQVRVVRTAAAAASTTTVAGSVAGGDSSSHELAPSLHTPSKSVPTRQRATRLASRRQLPSTTTTPVVGGAAPTTVVAETQSEDLDHSQGSSVGGGTSSLCDSFAVFHDIIAASASPAFRQRQMTVRPRPTPQSSSSSQGPVSVCSSLRSHAKSDGDGGGGGGDSADFPPPSEDDLTSSRSSVVLGVDAADSIVRGDLFAGMAAADSHDGDEAMDQATSPPPPPTTTTTATAASDSQLTVDAADGGGDERSVDRATAAGECSADGRHRAAVADAMDAEKRRQEEDDVMFDDDDDTDDTDDDIAANTDDVVVVRKQRRAPADLRVTCGGDDGAEVAMATIADDRDAAHRSPPQPSAIAAAAAADGHGLPSQILHRQQLTPVLSLTPSECSPPLSSSSSVSSCATLSPFSILKTGTTTSLLLSAQRSSHQRRVTFDLPEEVTSSPLDSPRRLKRHGGRPPRRLDMKQSILKQRGVTVPEGAVYPPLAMSGDLVERILPSLSSGGRSRGLLQLMKSRNIRTVGDLACLTPEDISSLPIRAPKVKVLTQALELFHVTRFSPGCTPKRQHVKRAVRRFTAAGMATSMAGIVDDSKDSSCSSLLLLLPDLEPSCCSSAESSMMSLDGGEADALDARFAPESLLGGCEDGEGAENVDPSAIARGSRGLCGPSSAATTAFAAVAEADGHAPQSGDSTLNDDEDDEEEEEEEEDMDCEVAAARQPSSDLAPGSQSSHVPAASRHLGAGVSAAVPLSSQAAASLGDEVAVAVGVGDVRTSFSFGSDDDETQDPSGDDAAPAADAAVVCDASAPVSGELDSSSDECLVPESEPEARVIGGGGGCVPETAPLSEESQSAPPTPEPRGEQSSSAADAAAVESAGTVPPATAVAATQGGGGEAFDCGDLSDDALDSSMALEEIDSLVASQCTMEDFDAELHGDRKSDDDDAGDVIASAGQSAAAAVAADTWGAPCLDSQLDITSSGGGGHDRRDDACAAAAAAARQPVVVDTQFSLAAGQGVVASAATATTTAGCGERPPSSPSAASVYDDALDTCSHPGDGDDDADAHNASMSSLDSQLPAGDDAASSWRHATALFESLTGDVLEAWSPRHLCNLQVQLSQLMGRVAYAIRSTAAPRRQPRL